MMLERVALSHAHYFHLFLRVFVLNLKCLGPHNLLIPFSILLESPGPYISVFMIDES